MTKAKAKAKKVEKEDRYEIRLSGSGGQGLILGGIILATAIGVGDGRNVVQTQSYGPEARGGASRADLVVADGEIYYPKSMKLDMLLALTQEACDTYFQDMKEGGILVVDSNMVTQLPTKNYFALPFVQAAREKIGNVIMANVVALGAIAEFTGIVTKESLKKAVLERAPRGTEDKNKRALELGIDMAKKAKKGK